MITDADRTAAESVYQNRDEPAMASWVKGGKKDADWVVQAFASHREEAYALGRIEGEKAMQDAAIIAIRRFFAQKP